MRIIDLPRDARDRIKPAELEGTAELTLVGWYCAGGHETVDYSDGQPRPGVAEPSLRFSNPCAHGVPVYALTNPT